MRHALAFFFTLVVLALCASVGFAQDARSRQHEASVQRIAELKESVKALIEALRDDDPAVRREATDALGQVQLDLDASIGPLVDRLRDRDPLVRLAALRALRRLDSKSSIIRLTERILDDDPRVQVEAMLTVDALAKQETEFVRGDDGLDDPFGGNGKVLRFVPPDWYHEFVQKANTPATRGMLAIAYRQPSSDIEAAVPVILQVIGTWKSDSAQWDVFDEFTVLRQIGTEDLADFLFHDEQAIRRAAARLLFRRFDNAEVLPRLMESLSGRDPVVRLYSAVMIRNAEYAVRDSSEVQQSVLPLLDDPAEAVRCAGAEGLAVYGSPDLQPLANALRRDESPRVRFRVFLALGGELERADNSETAADVKSVLRKLHQDKDAAVRALATLVELDDFPEEKELRDFRANKDLAAAVPLLLKAIQQERRHPLPRRDFPPPADYLAAEINCLGAIGPQAKAAAPALLAEVRARGNLGYGDDRIPANSPLPDILFALSNIFPDEAPELIKALDDESRVVRTMAAMALACNQHHAGRTIPVLIQSWDHSCWGPCRFLMPHRMDTLCLTELGDAAVPALLEQLRRGRHPDEAERAFLFMDSSADKVVPLLLPVLRDKSEPERARTTVAEVLGVFGDDHAEVKASLVTILTNREEPEAVRAAAAVGLSRLGTKAVTALDALKRTADDDSTVVRKSARSAIEYIEKAIRSEEQKERSHSSD